MPTASERAWRVVLGRVRPRLNGDHQAKLQHLFLRHVDIQGEHWIWTAALDAYGYEGRRSPIFRFVRQDRTATHIRAFRFLMEQFLPDAGYVAGAHYRVTCGEERCISPYHRSRTKLTWAEKGRQHPKRKYTDEQILRILRAGSREYGTIAEDLGMPNGTARNIRSGRSHKHLWESVHGEAAPVFRDEDLDVKRGYRAKARSKAHVKRRRSAGNRHDH